MSTFTTSKMTVLLFLISTDGCIIQAFYVLTRRVVRFFFRSGLDVLICFFKLVQNPFVKFKLHVHDLVLRNNHDLELLMSEDKAMSLKSRHFDSHFFFFAFHKMRHYSRCDCRLYKEGRINSGNSATNKRSMEIIFYIKLICHSCI